MIDLLTRVFANDVDFQRSTSPGDSIEAFYLRPRRHRPAAGASLRHDHGPRSDLQILPLPDARRQHASTITTRAAVRAASFLCASRSPKATSLRRSACASTRSCTSRACTPASTGPRRSARRSSPPATASIIKAGWDFGLRPPRRDPARQRLRDHLQPHVRLRRGASRRAPMSRQGQVVGYLGQSGLATGPHLHYEVIINGNFVDPMAIKLARTREFDGKMLAAFKRERDRIDQLRCAGAVGRRGIGRKARRGRDRQAQLRLGQSSATAKAAALGRRPAGEAQRCANSLRRHALLPQRGERRRSSAFRQLAAVGVEHEAMVTIARRRRGRAAPAAGDERRSRRRGPGRARRR